MEDLTKTGSMGLGTIYFRYAIPDQMLQGARRTHEPSLATSQWSQQQFFFPPGRSRSENQELPDHQGSVSPSSHVRYRQKYEGHRGVHVIPEKVGHGCLWKNCADWSDDDYDTTPNEGNSFGNDNLVTLAVVVILAQYLNDATVKDIMSVTAAYVAVLVLFVGTSFPPAGSG